MSPYVVHIVEKLLIMSDLTPLPVETPNYIIRQGAFTAALVIFGTAILVGIIAFKAMFVYGNMRAQEKGVEECAPKELFDIAKIGDQDYAVCETDSEQYDLKPLN